MVPFIVVSVFYVFCYENLYRLSGFGNYNDSNIKGGSRYIFKNDGILIKKRQNTEKEDRLLFSCFHIQNNYAILNITDEIAVYCHHQNG